jgi:hypothetical protein
MTHGESESVPRELLPGVWHWSARTASGSDDAYAFLREGRTVLVDPVTLGASAVDAFGALEAIVLTSAHHERAAWAIRRLRGTHVYAPEGARLSERPDHRYSGGDLLPGGLTAFHAPGIDPAQYVLWRARPVSVVYLSDVVLCDGDGTPHLESAARASLVRVLDDVPFVAAFVAHGPPIVDRARERLAMLVGGEAGAHPA